MNARRHEDMEPPDCDMDDEDWFCETCGSVVKEEGEYCQDCQREADEMNGIPTNGTAETATITVPKLTTLDGKPTCALDWHWDHLRCPLVRTRKFGMVYECAWTDSELPTDNPDGSGYLRPCKNCPIHKSP